tara:strand:- start:205 stop:903 length:699 start_codon:yes stop_codon:yes gene_type:complete
MKKQILLIFLGLVLFFPHQSKSQSEPDELGAWYMYIFNTSFNDSQWGFQGDIQHRNFNILGDLQQIMLRGGINYKPKNTPLKLVLGYANITTGTQGSSNAMFSENRLYQETSFAIKLGKKIYSNHRFRYELRYVDDHNIRTRYRYNLFINISLKGEMIVAKTPYFAFYNELFINGQRNIGMGRTVEFFDRNRFYSAFGYMIREGLKVQLGLMRQTTNLSGKNQLQLSFHHSF